MINKLSRYYCNHIMDHVIKSNDPIVINNAVEKMQINRLAGLHYFVHNDDPSEKHKFCMSKNAKWCKYKNELGSLLASTSHSKHKKSKLPASFLPYMQPLYQQLSETELLKRCVAGYTLNQNEAFNATLWRRCLKEKNFGTAAVEHALALAVMSWNAGQQGLVGVIEKLGFKPTIFTKKAVTIKDKLRLANTECSLRIVKKRKVTTQAQSSNLHPWWLLICLIQFFLFKLSLLILLLIFILP